MLTKAILEAMPLDTVFAGGETTDDPDGINMTCSRDQLRWMAVRGWTFDWVIYCHWAKHEYDWIARNGDKVTGEHNIRKLVPCDDEAYALYRR